MVPEKICPVIWIIRRRHINVFPVRSAETQTADGHSRQPDLEREISLRIEPADLFRPAGRPDSASCIHRQSVAADIFDKYFLAGKTAFFIAVTVDGLFGRGSKIETGTVRRKNHAVGDAAAGIEKMERSVGSQIPEFARPMLEIFGQDRAENMSVRSRGHIVELIPVPVIFQRGKKSGFFSGFPGPDFAFRTKQQESTVRLLGEGIHASSAVGTERFEIPDPGSRIPFSGE